MIECTQCGKRCEPGEQFCGSCGAFLEWTEPAAATSPRPAAAVPEQPAPRTSVRAESPAEAPPVPPRPETAPMQAAPAAASPAAAPVQPRAGEPVAARPRPTAVSAPDEPPPAPGDLICGQCGAGNVPTRRFCRRCGTSLADAPAAPQASWWRRLFTRRPRTAPAAGDRPGPGFSGRVRRPRFLVPVLVLAVLCAAVFALRPQLRQATEAVKDRLATPQQVHAVGVSASSASRGHAASLAVDGTTDRYWAPDREGDGKGQYLEARFDEPFRLLDVIVYPGISTNAQQFLTQGRPQTLLATVTDAHGTVTRHTVNLADSAGEQKFHFAVSDVVRVRLTIESAYGAGSGHRVAVGEVEFFKRG
ncbi:NADase-type glycan-binding domain-containing protein [Streptomyces sp. NPDC088733]|uniref:zinc ribbon domain-containing protein n=1 Tax=Streptomyces sp. NPDC088733 TaxID=3365880 RepID=UPI003829CCE1